MTLQLWIFLAMLGVFLLCAFAFKLPVSISMILASIMGCLLGGQGVPARHLIEGTFSYVDTILVIACAMIFMRVIQNSGALDALSYSIIRHFHKHPVILLMLIMLVIMFPGMITGSSTAAVLSAGSIMTPVLLSMGIPEINVATIIAMGGIFGMIAPPVNIPAMIIGGGVDIPYIGFGLPLVLLSWPLAFFTVLSLGLKYAKETDYNKVLASMDNKVIEKFGFKLYIPLLAAIVLMVINQFIPQLPNLGMPLIFMISAIIGLFTGYRMEVKKVFKDAIHDVLPVMGILMGVGMFIQTMTLTGVRGWIVTRCLSMPDVWRYVAMAVFIPLFGAVSSFGAASVMGVPFLLALISKDQIVTAAAISLLAGIGDMVPPTALAGIFAAQVVGIKDYRPILKKSRIPILGMIIVSLLFIIFANNMAPHIVIK